MNIQSPFPEDPDALIAALEEIFPDKVPSLNDSDREVWAKVGEVRVVSFIKAWRKAYLEKQPYVRTQNAKADNPGASRQARAGIHEPVLRKSRSRRSRRSRRKEQPKD